VRSVGPPPERSPSRWPSRSRDPERADEFSQMQKPEKLRGYENIIPKHTEKK